MTRVHHAPLEQERRFPTERRAEAEAWRARLSLSLSARRISELYARRKFVLLQRLKQETATKLLLKRGIYVPGEILSLESAATLPLLSLLSHPSRSLSAAVRTSLPWHS